MEPISWEEIPENHYFGESIKTLGIVFFQGQFYNKYQRNYYTKICNKAAGTI